MEEIERLSAAAGLAHGRRIAAEVPFLGTKGSNYEAAKRYAGAVREEYSASEALMLATADLMKKTFPSQEP